jgi:hypothetical protein
MPSIESQEKYLWSVKEFSSASSVMQIYLVLSLRILLNKLAQRPFPADLDVWRQEGT